LNLKKEIIHILGEIYVSNLEKAKIKSFCDFNGS